MAQFSLNQNYDIGLVPNDWNATPVSTSIENLYTFDVHVEERFQINEKIGQNLIEENEELKQRVLYLENQLDILMKRFDELAPLGWVSKHMFYQQAPEQFLQGMQRVESEHQMIDQKKPRFQKESQLLQGQYLPQ